MLYHTRNRLVNICLSLSLFFQTYSCKGFVHSALFLGQHNYSSPTSRFLPVTLTGHSSPKIILEFSWLFIIINLLSLYITLTFSHITFLSLCVHFHFLSHSYPLVGQNIWDRKLVCFFFLQIPNTKEYLFELKFKIFCIHNIFVYVYT